MDSFRAFCKNPSGVAKTSTRSSTTPDHLSARTPQICSNNPRSSLCSNNPRSSHCSDSVSTASTASRRSIPQLFARFLPSKLHPSKTKRQSASSRGSSTQEINTSFDDICCATSETVRTTSVEVTSTEVVRTVSEVLLHRDDPELAEQKITFADFLMAEGGRRGAQEGKEGRVREVMVNRDEGKMDLHLLSRLLSRAIRNDHFGVVRGLVEMGADVNSGSSSRSTDSLPPPTQEQASPAGTDSLPPPVSAGEAKTSVSEQQVKSSSDIVVVVSHEKNNSGPGRPRGPGAAVKPPQPQGDRGDHGRVSSNTSSGAGRGKSLWLCGARCVFCVAVLSRVSSRSFGINHGP